MTFTSEKPYREDNPIRLAVVFDRTQKTLPAAEPLSFFDIEDSLSDAKSDHERFQILLSAIRYYPKDSFYVHQAAKLCLAQGEEKTAYNLLQEALKVTIPDAHILGLLLPLSLKFLNTEEANQLTDRSLVLVGNNPTSIDLGLVIQARLAGGRVDEANQLADKLLALEREHPTSIGLGLAIQARLVGGRVDEANQLADVKLALERERPTSIGLGLVIQARLAGGRVDESRVLIEKLRQSDTTNMYADYFEAKCDFYLGSYKRAQQTLRRLLNGNLTGNIFGVASLYLATMYEEHHKIDQQDPLIGTILAARPELANRLCNFVVLLSNRVDRTEDPISYYPRLFSSTDWGVIESGTPINRQTVLQMADVPVPVIRGLMPS